ncbi:MAG: hypothetical protein JO340_16195 [Acidobacteriaceae bacterium]|nr:hypothetical protein [Acidobacteriaceae bacterium]
MNSNRISESIKVKLDIVIVVGEYVDLKRQGTGPRYVGLCPFHSEKTPSFGVHQGRQFYYCFGCNAGGDVFKFIQEKEALTFPQALRFLAERYGIGGTDLATDRPRRPHHSESTLVRSEQLVVGLSWRIQRALEATKAELFGPEHEKAARATQVLTYWSDQIRSWRYLTLNGPPKDPRSYWELVWSHGGREEAVMLLLKLPRKLVRECIAEAREAQMQLAAVLVGAAGNSRKDAAA